MSDYEYDGDTGCEFIDGQWIVVDSQQNDRWNEQAQWYKIQNSVIPKEFQEGYAAADIYAASHSNPYPGGSKQWSDWEAGFAKRERELPPTGFSTYNRDSNATAPK